MDKPPEKNLAGVLEAEFLGGEEEGRGGGGSKRQCCFNRLGNVQGALGLVCENPLQLGLVNV